MAYGSVIFKCFGSVTQASFSHTEVEEQQRALLWSEVKRLRISVRSVMLHSDSGINTQSYTVVISEKQTHSRASVLVFWNQCQGTSLLTYVN